MRNNLITRKMKYYNLIIILLMMFSCTNREVVDNGVSIKYFKNGIGDVVENDEFIMLNIQYFDYEGNEEFNSQSQ